MELPGIAVSKVKFPFEDPDAKITLRRDEETATCSTRVYVRVAGLIPLHELVLRIINVA